MVRVKRDCLLKSAQQHGAPQKRLQIRLWRLALVGCCAHHFLLDQLTKIAIVGAFQLGETLPMTSFFNLVRVHNPGAAFSFLADAGGWQRWFFTGLGVVAALVMVYLLRMHAGQTLFCLALSLLLGGAVGNVVDRVLYSHVIDFLDFYYGTWHFPAFNVADSAISLGAGLLILDELLRVRKAR